MSEQKQIDVVRRVVDSLGVWMEKNPAVDADCISPADVVYNVDSQLFMANEGYGVANLMLLVGRVADKLQIPIEDAKAMVYNTLADPTTAGIFCGLVLDISE